MSRPSERKICALIGCPYVSECSVSIRECSEEMWKGWAVKLLDLSSTIPVTPAIKILFYDLDGVETHFDSIESFVGDNKIQPEIADLIRSLGPGESMGVDEAGVCEVHRLW